MGGAALPVGGVARRHRGRSDSGDSASRPRPCALDFVIPLFLAGEVAARLNNHATRRAVAVAVAIAVGAVSAPMHSGVMLAIAAGVAAGLLAQGSDR